jgi:hypothetical protein
MINEMKSNVETPALEEEKFFSIADQGMIFDILRNKLYSNPILAICREYSCNARDSMRESGKGNQPIEIHLPFTEEPQYRVKDCGTGISPDRIENIFIKYAASTKREDNSQTGSFGIGGKCAMSYSDAFEIETIFDGIKYNYSCYIDKTKVGKLALLKKEATTLSNGTEIIIPVKYQDYNSFAQFTKQVCQHWEVKPTFTGKVSISWDNPVKLVGNQKYAVIQNHSYRNTIKCIIDGIEYSLDEETLNKHYIDTALIHSIRGHLLLYFENRELTLAANREQIGWDKPSQEKIKARLKEIKTALISCVQDELAAQANLWQANIYYRSKTERVFHQH